MCQDELDSQGPGGATGETKAGMQQEPIIGQEKNFQDRGTMAWKVAETEEERPVRRPWQPLGKEVGSQGPAGGQSSHRPLLTALAAFSRAAHSGELFGFLFPCDFGYPEMSVCQSHSPIRQCGGW